MNAQRWDAAAATALFRRGGEAWPYREYVELLHAVWQANQKRNPLLKVLALGPGIGWRERLLPAQTYDGFMAERILQHLQKAGGRVLIYAGLNHSFTRYHQPEEGRARVDRFVDRMGNKLWREFGEDAFVIVLHHPWRCRRTDGQGARCLPAGGAIDCAGGALGRSVGFDLAGSPFAEARIGREFGYGQGYPDLRLMDMTDGYVWTKPIAQYANVSLVPLDEFAPDEAAFLKLQERNPFSDEQKASRAAMMKLWEEQRQWLQNPIVSRAWTQVAKESSACTQR